MKNIFSVVFLILMILLMAQINTYAAEPGKDSWQYLAAHPVEKPIYNWRLQSSVASIAFDIWHKAFAEDLAKKTGGRILCTAYKAGALFAPSQIIHAVKDGAIQLGADFGPYHAGLIPIANFLGGLPFAFETPEQYNEFWWDWRGKLLPRIINEMGYHPKNVHYLGAIAMNNCMYGNFKINKAEGLKGKKLAFLGLWADMAMQFGAVSVNIPAAERYEAMQRGTIDGGALPAFSFVQYKAIEVSKYFYLPPFGNGSSQVYINHSVWKGLSPPLQDAVYWSCRELGFSYYKQYKENLDDPALEEIQKKIHLLTFPEAEVQKLRSAAMKSWNKAAVKSEGCQRVYDLLLEYGREKKYLK